MKGIARFFFIAALAYAVLGFVVGLSMAITHDHSQLPTHAHIMVIGWLSFFCFAVFYHLFEDRMSRAMALAHFGLAQVAMLVLAIGLYLVYSGQTQFAPVPAVGASAYALSFLIFAAGSWRAIHSKAG